MKKYLITLLVLSFTCSVVHAKGEIGVNYGFAFIKSDRVAKKKLKSSKDIKLIIELIREKIQLPTDLEIYFGGKEGPHYDSGEHKISIPYSFLNEVENRFKKVNYEETGVSAQQAMIDSIIHTLMHEVAHAVIQLNEVPMVTKEEDAADSLAMYFIVKYIEDGQEIVLSAADLFDLESTERVEFSESDFWGEHSLDEQRYYASQCYVFGSDPEKYEDLFEDDDEYEERADLCLELYENTSSSWDRLLNL